jgi:hypothetical protein
MKKWISEYKKQTKYKPGELRQLADRFMEEFDKNEAEVRKSALSLSPSNFLC